MNEIDINKEILFVIVPKDKEYMLQTVRKGNGEYGDRKKLPASWAGKRDNELSMITGVKDAVFCHDARFIASAGSLEGVLKMAELALAEPVEKAELAEKIDFLEVFDKRIFKGLFKKVLSKKLPFQMLKFKKRIRIRL